MIAIGSQLGGPEQLGAPIHVALNLAMNAAADGRSPAYDDGQEGWINPIFIVPGSVIGPELVGLKLGHFSKKKKGLVIQIAVPERVAKGEGISSFIVESLREAVQMSARHFQDNGIIFPALKAEKIIGEIDRKLAGR